MSVKLNKLLIIKKLKEIFNLDLTKQVNLLYDESKDLDYYLCLGSLEWLKNEQLAFVPNSQKWLEFENVIAIAKQIVLCNNDDKTLKQNVKNSTYKLLQKN